MATTQRHWRVGASTIARPFFAFVGARPDAAVPDTVEVGSAPAEGPMLMWNLAMPFQHRAGIGPHRRRDWPARPLRAKTGA
jgi:hypothetical protein